MSQAGGARPGPRGKRAWLGLLPALALSAACFSPFPLDPSPQQPTDERLIGSWRCIPLSADEDDDATLTVRPGDDPEGRTYFLDWRETGADPDSYEAFASLLWGGPVVNVRERGDAQGKWTFLRYSLLRDNVLHVQGADHKIFEPEAPASSAQARALLERVGERAFEDFALCVRAGRLP